MLQIKKNSVLTSLKYNLNFLFRNRRLTQHYRASRHVTQSITLRSPKHFNIGKHKILNLNYQTPKALVRIHKKIKVMSFLSQSDLLFRVSSKVLLLTPTLSLRSVRMAIKAKFKIKWLEI